MIKDYDGNKTTPKRKAEELLRDALVLKLEYWFEENEVKDMTEKEYKSVQEQMNKILPRLLKKLNYQS